MKFWIRFQYKFVDWNSINSSKYNNFRNITGFYLFQSDVIGLIYQNRQLKEVLSLKALIFVIAELWISLLILPFISFRKFPSIFFGTFFMTFFSLGLVSSIAFSGSLTTAGSSDISCNH